MVFLGDIAFYMATLVFAAGIYMIHHANHHDSGKPCKLLRSGGYLVIVISLLGMLCTGYYWLKYFSQGDFNRPHANHSMMMKNMMGKGGMMGKGNMMGTDRMIGKGHMMGNMQHCMGQMEGKMMDPSMIESMKSCMMSKGINSDSKELNEEVYDTHQ